MEILLLQDKGLIVPFRLYEISDLLPVGKELTGRVLSSMGDQRAIMLFQGVPVMAETSRQLEEGSLVRVKVLQPGPPPVVRIISQVPPEEKRLLSVLKNFVSVEPKPISEWMGTFRTEFQAAKSWLKDQLHIDYPFEKTLSRFDHLVMSEDETPPSTQRIRSFLLDSGMGYEEKIIRWITGNLPKSLDHRHFYLSDAKGILMALERDLNNRQIPAQGDTTEKEQGFLQKLSEGVRQIEFQQAMNAFSDLDEGYLNFQIPLQFHDERTTLWIQVRSREKGGREGQTRRDTEMVFSLELQALGKLRIHTSARSQSLQCRIEVERSDTVTLIRSLLPELQNNLVSKGYYVELLECVVKELSETMPELSLKNVLPTGLKMLDVVI